MKCLRQAFQGKDDELQQVFKHKAKTGQVY